MGRAIVRDPAVFLFDEPLSNLDAKLRVQMRAEIKELHQRIVDHGIYVTHDQIEAMTMADVIVVLRDGQIEQIGKPLEIYDHPANLFVAEFIGSPSMNVLSGEVSSQSGHPGGALQRPGVAVASGYAGHARTDRQVWHPTRAFAAGVRWPRFPGQGLGRRTDRS